jgi:DNA modification methylase
MKNKFKINKKDEYSEIIFHSIFEENIEIKFLNPLTVKCFNDSEYEIDVEFDFGLTTKIIISKSTEKEIAKQIIFDIFHSFNHNQNDPNYDYYNWALYGNLKDRITIIEKRSAKNTIQINNLYCENCLVTMDKMPDNFIDLTVTSPPYDDLREYNGYEFEFKTIANELYRVTKEGGIIVWIVSDATINGSETGTSFNQANYFKSIGFNIHDTMIYLKDNPVPVGGNNRYYQHFEYMFVFSKGKPKTFNPITMERRNKWNDKRTERIKGFNRNKQGEFNKKKVSLTGEVKIGNVWKYVVGGGNSVPYGVKHPAVFPEKIVKDHIISWSNEGDIVYDPFMGSGTTAVVALNNNRKWIGSEISKEYCEISNERIKKIVDFKKTFGII